MWGSDILITPKYAPILRLIVSYILQRMNLITTDANHMKDTMVTLGVYPSKIKIIYFGTDVERFHPGKRDPRLRKNLDCQNSLIVISLRNLEPLYDIETLIKAASLVLEEVKNVKFLILGEGSEEMRLKRLAKDLGVRDKIIFKGWVDQEELPRYLASSDIYVSTSLSDAGLAASTSEAMASGLPVVITDFGENIEWIKEGGGFTFPLRDYKTLAEKITFLAKNEDVRISFGEINRSTIERKNNYYKEMEKIENEYKNIVKKELS